jgi:hypothetical protein
MPNESNSNQIFATPSAGQTADSNQISATPTSGPGATALSNQISLTPYYSVPLISPRLPLRSAQPGPGTSYGIDGGAYSGICEIIPGTITAQSLAPGVGAGGVAPGNPDQLAYYPIAGATVAGLTLGTNLSISNGVINATGGGGGGGSVNPGTTNQLAYYAANGDVVSGLNLGSGLSISGGTLNVSGGGGGAGDTMQQVSFVLSPGTALMTGVNLFGKVIAGLAGTTQKWKALAEVNPSTGGFTFDIWQNGTSIFSSPIVIAASTTTVQSGNTFVSTTVSENDLFQCNINAVGTGVQSVKIIVYVLETNP